MLTIIRDQAEERFDTLPDVLKDAVFSIPINEEIERICFANHLDPVKKSLVGQLVGRVLMGFIHDADLSKEIREATGIDSRIADAIAAEIDKKIFAPIRSELQKVYKPAVQEAASSRQQVASELVQLTAPPVPQDSIIDLKNPKIIPLGDSESESIKAKVEIQEIKEVPALSPSLSTFTKEEAPVILHQEEVIKPVAAEQKRSLGGLMGFFSRDTKKSEPAPVKAEVDLGIVKVKSESEKSKSGIPQHPTFTPSLSLSTPSSAVPGISIKHDGEAVTKTGEKVKIVHYGPLDSEKGIAKSEEQKSVEMMQERKLEPKPQSLSTSPSPLSTHPAPPPPAFVPKYTNPMTMRSQQLTTNDLRPTTEKATAITPSAASPVIDLGRKNVAPPVNLPVDLRSESESEKVSAEGARLPEGQGSASGGKAEEKNASKVIDLSQGLSADPGRLAKMFNRIPNEGKTENRMPPPTPPSPEPFRSAPAQSAPSDEEIIDLRNL